jgi:hypothetical protein
MLFALQMEGDAVEAVIADAEQLAGMLQPMYRELQVSSPSIHCSNACCLGSSKQPHGGESTPPMPAAVSVLVGLLACRLGSVKTSLQCCCHGHVCVVTAGAGQVPCASQQPAS